MYLGDDLSLAPVEKRTFSRYVTLDVVGSCESIFGGVVLNRHRRDLRESILFHDPEYSGVSEILQKGPQNLKGFFFAMEQQYMP